MGASYDHLDELEAVEELQRRILDTQDRVDVAAMAAQLVLRTWRERGPSVADQRQVAADEILDAAVTGRWDDVSEKMFGALTGADVQAMAANAYVMAVTWCQAYQRHATGARAGVQPGDEQMFGIDADGARVDVADLRPVRRWACDLIGAWCRQDLKAFTRTWQAMPQTSPDEETPLSVVLILVATTIRDTPRGWAVDADSYARAVAGAGGER